MFLIANILWSHEGRSSPAGRSHALLSHRRNQPDSAGRVTEFK
jgi:hypothetical protein